MPKMKCICGNTIGLGEIPSPNQYLLISDMEFDKFQGHVEAEDIYKEMKPVVHCSQCERIHIFWNGFNQPFDSYRKDT